AYYPAANGKPEISHKDFMVIYKIADSIKAIYFDNENHIINYSVVADSGKAIFTSDASPNAPQFRLTYMLTSNDKMEIVFDIAPPGKTFFTYLAGKLKRK
ncbi:MAG: hypothetical protein Q8903_14090, partial [Bacteroidota bacterium]|nr:hypothetical protein [Bacteroidota bacterium]